MKQITDYKNKKILVLGLAKSGFGAAKLLNDLGALVTVNDGKPLADNPQAQDLMTLGIRVITGSHPLELLDESFDLMVKNPGIPYSNPMIKRAIEKQMPVITEVELAYRVCEGDIIGITGTNGKTTTTTMIGEIINASGRIGALAGNIGFPASIVAENVKSDEYMVTELSSFQLMGIQKFRPNIAVITNIFSAHLDYHGTREAYVAAKWRIQENQDSDDFLVINYNQAELRQLAEKAQAQVIPFSTVERVEGAYLEAGNLFYKAEKIMPANDLGVPGQHNIENALAAIAVAKLIGIDNAEIKRTLSTFSGVKHRTQYLGQVRGIRFYNDSKATNILATERALSGFNNEKVFLLAGGLDRGNSFDELVEAIRGLKGLFVFGETKEKLAEAAKKAGISQVKQFASLTEATDYAYSLAQPEDTILLSPANASWDQYKTFEIRGEEFISLFEKYKEQAEVL
ncbi:MULTISPECIES: UDP-N-acetylmuramoyl-L-alanine--D-glutamate ligase [unclassified Enterococcus]|uniref:UDP-N-acetylmuramoyl-L-alanine--D-glutamate ligase n=1 Tax=unclassified Enterococcus TaxID=2608891 RepID=UPI0015571455|nr:UDP-N-acetylmuramoyl-L-alanine--D-glutamate ligase [Enterococcus sp. MMGLQ5-2]MBS7584927.1 UDP-N-acetylmuramoyl-L-alanine--D-glutamate ligase [Enterococcus sp. MMGLQ5-1]NPD12782.1 UDP-N-acetylmuramoyl-L-alanine--D-glutamate ligase [Enterococcus sp. MMGLQ5-1]NPD37407.1 UDP-N-acetylmuramoyl-L-alanine--D-glutamate ligase [Enterococcus sp. MMGLQ5-2]